MARNMMAASATVRASGPTWSRLLQSGITPWQLTRPNDGLRPTMPQSAAGMRIEPPVSVPTEATHIPDAMAAAEPPLDPPAMRSVFQGLLGSDGQIGVELGIELLDAAEKRFDQLDR